VIKHYKGVCHVYVDEGADQDMAVKICVNAKTQRPGVCNAMETLLVHRAAAPELLPRLAEALRDRGVELRGCPETVRMIPGPGERRKRTGEPKYLDLILAVKVVPGIEEAISHIHRYGSLHTESIVTSDYQRAQRFLREVESSTVLVNASTRFSDGFEFGLGQRSASVHQAPCLWTHGARRAHHDQVHRIRERADQGMTTWSVQPLRPPPSRSRPPRQKCVVYGDRHIREQPAKTVLTP